MIEQEDNDELTAAYLAGCHDTRKAYEQRLAAAEEKLFATEELAKEYSMLSEVAKDRDWYDGLRIVKPWQVKEDSGSE